jgi:hypothetical protein
MFVLSDSTGDRQIRHTKTLSHMRTRKLEERVLVLLDSIPRTMKCHIDTWMLLNVTQQAGRYHWRLVDIGVHESSRMRKSDPGSLEIIMTMPSFHEHLGQKKLEIGFCWAKKLRIGLYHAHLQHPHCRNESAASATNGR